MYFNPISAPGGFEATIAGVAGALQEKMTAQLGFKPHAKLPSGECRISRNGSFGKTVKGTMGDAEVAPLDGGLEQVELMVSANRGQSLRLRKVASGGEA